MLLNECGIDNVIVIGEAGDEAHSWNMVKMSNGSWYYCDLTWDDNSMMLYDLGSFDRFMKGSTVFSDHTLGCENVVIHGVKNSYARKYAKVYGYKFTTKKLR